MIEVVPRNAEKIIDLGVPVTPAVADLAVAVEQHPGRAYSALLEIGA